METGTQGRSGRAHRWGYVGILALAFLLRVSGLHRGLDVGYGYHPDEPKQVAALARYLRGEYRWYTDRAAYDGYPLFLNHLDEWIMRATRPFRHGWRAYVQPDRPPQEPTGRELYRFARNLRALYGVLTVAAVLFAARRLGCPPLAAQFAGLLLAITPVSFGVAHFATGDVGAELFSAATLALLAQHARSPRCGWLLAVGAAIGGSFASKYNGLLVAIAVAFYLAARGFVGPRGVRRLAAEGAAVLGGFVAAVAAGEPHWVVDFTATWRTFLRAVRYIKNYAVPDEILALPAGERALLSLRVNTAEILSHFGWATVALALGALAWSVYRTIRIRRASRGDERLLNLAFLRAAVFIFPPIALIVSLATKYRVQVLHFSFVQVGFALGAAHTLVALAEPRRTTHRALAVALALAALAELAVPAARETFFWRRDDIHAALSDFKGVFRDPETVRSARRGAPGRNTVRDYNLESRNATNFRNRPHVVSIPDGAWWNAVRQPPLPTVPLAESSSWVFAHGPVFPRSDREFRVAANARVERHVVWHTAPAEAVFGLRSGRTPAIVELRYGGARARVELEPHQQIELPVAPRNWRVSRRAIRDKDPVFLVPLSVRALNGAVTVAVLADPREALTFRAFGGDPAALRRLAAERPDRAEALAALERTRFLEGGREAPLALSRAEQTETIEGVGPLPAGRYTMTLDVDAGAAGARFTIAWSDRDGRPVPPEAGPKEILLPPGLRRVEWRFSKTFAPYDGKPSVRLMEGEGRIVAWELRPDAAALWDDLEALAAGGPAPAWCRRFPPTPPAGGVERKVGVRYGGGGELEIESVALPEVLRPGEPFEAWARLRARGVLRWSEQRALVRVMNAEGRTVTTLELHAPRAAVGAAPPAPQTFALPEGAAAGEYRLLARGYNERTRLRAPVYTAAERREFAGDWVVFGTVRVEPMR